MHKASSLCDYVVLGNNKSCRVSLLNTLLTITVRNLVSAKENVRHLTWYMWSYLKKLDFSYTKLLFIISRFSFIDTDSNRKAGDGIGTSLCCSTTSTRSKMFYYFSAVLQLRWLHCTSNLNDCNYQTATWWYLSTPKN